MNQILRKALADASPLLEQLEIAPQSAFLLGNGDLTGLLMGDEQGFLIHLGKNDVWDQRLVMEDDQRIYTAAQVKEEAMANAPWPDQLCGEPGQQSAGFRRKGQL